ncbi:MAG: hypothetical protein A2Y93_00650 [Chloroflexi bacterium RBG_13_68_17]|nr:MAG: hypothetical protein A2Y93_00650 [Chloroflexi bacterium RBG_13_68_17]
MSESEPAGGRTAVRGLFGRIARRYDLLNRVMTLGRDRAWRRDAIRRVRLPCLGRLLDLGAGPGDLAAEALRRDPGARVVTADLTPEMMRLGRGRLRDRSIAWVCADARHLPFAGSAFDGVVSGFLLRNVGDTLQSLAEQLRVLRPGAWMACLDTTPPGPGLVGWLVRMYLFQAVPRLGRWLAGDEAAYTYLARSTAEFVAAEDLAAQLSATGFHQVGFCRRMLGAVAIHSGRRPVAPPSRKAPAASSI